MRPAVCARPAACDSNPRWPRGGARRRWAADEGRRTDRARSCAGLAATARPAVSLREESTPQCGILYDEALVSAPYEGLFDPEHWRARGALAGTGGGRGA